MRKFLPVLFLFIFSAYAWPGGYKKLIEASDVSVDSTELDNNLSSCGDDCTVQEALEIIDEMAGGGGSGDVTAVGDCASGACFNGTQGTTLTFNNAGGDGTIDYDGTDFSFSHAIALLDNSYIGLGAAAGRIEFDDQATDQVNVLNAFMGLGTDDPQRLFHLATSSSSRTTLQAFDSTDTTDGNGSVISFRTTTSGAGATAFTELAGIAFTVVTHDHATRNGMLQFATAAAGAIAFRMTILGNGNTGFLTTAPDRVVEINSATGATLRHTYNDSDGNAANYVDESVSSSGDFTIAPSGGDVTSVGTFGVNNGATGSGILAIFEDTDSGTNKATFQVPALASDTAYILPADDGDADQVLSTNGSGTLDWVTAGSGSGDIESVTAGAGLTGGGTSGAVTLDVIGTADRITVNANDIDIAATYVGQASITTLGTITTGVWDGTDLTAGELGVDSVSASELNATGVEAELEAVMDLQDMQGAVVDSQVPNTITIDLAAVATTANAGDSATSFFSSGAIEDARGGLAFWQKTFLPEQATLSSTAPPGISFVTSSGSGGAAFRTLDFDQATDEVAWYTFVVPSDMAAGNWVLDIYWFANSTTAGADAVWATVLSATTVGDADTPLEQVIGTITTGSSDTNTTEANRLNQTTISFSQLDSVAAGDVVTVVITRDANDSLGDAGDDSLGVDARIYAMRLKIPRV